MRAGALVDEAAASQAHRRRSLGPSLSTVNEEPGRGSKTPSPTDNGPAVASSADWLSTSSGCAARPVVYFSMKGFNLTGLAAPTGSPLLPGALLAPLFLFQWKG